MSPQKPLKTYQRKSRLQLHNSSKSVDAVNALFAQNLTKRLRSRRKKIQLKDLPQRTQTYVTDESLNIETNNTFDRLVQTKNHNPVEACNLVEQKSSESRASARSIEHSFSRGTPVITRSRTKQINLKSLVPQRYNEGISKSLSIEMERSHKSTFSSLSYIKVPIILKSATLDIKQSTFSDTSTEQHNVPASTPFVIAPTRFINTPVSPSPITKSGSDKLIEKSYDQIRDWDNVPPFQNETPVKVSLRKRIGRKLSNDWKLQHQPKVYIANYHVINSSQENVDKGNTHEKKTLGISQVTFKDNLQLVKLKKVKKIQSDDSEKHSSIEVDNQQTNLSDNLKVNQQNIDTTVSKVMEDRRLYVKLSTPAAQWGKNMHDLTNLQSSTHFYHSSVDQIENSLSISLKTPRRNYRERRRILDSSLNLQMNTSYDFRKINESPERRNKTVSSSNQGMSLTETQSKESKQNDTPVKALRGRRKTIDHSFRLQANSSKKKQSSKKRSKTASSNLEMYKQEKTRMGKELVRDCSQNAKLLRGGRKITDTSLNFQMNRNAENTGFHKYNLTKTVGIKETKTVQDVSGKRSMSRRLCVVLDKSLSLHKDNLQGKFELKKKSSIDNSLCSLDTSKRRSRLRQSIRQSLKTKLDNLTQESDESIIYVGELQKLNVYNTSEKNSSIISESSFQNDKSYIDEPKQMLMRLKSANEKPENSRLESVPAVCHNLNEPLMKDAVEGLVDLFKDNVPCSPVRTGNEQKDSSSYVNASRKISPGQKSNIRKFSKKKKRLSYAKFVTTRQQTKPTLTVHQKVFDDFIDDHYKTNTNEGLLTTPTISGIDAIAKESTNIYPDIACNKSLPFLTPSGACTFIPVRSDSRINIVSNIIFEPNTRFDLDASKRSIEHDHSYFDTSELNKNAPATLDFHNYSKKSPLEWQDSSVASSDIIESSQLMETSRKILKPKSIKIKPGKSYRRSLSLLRRSSIIVDAKIQCCGDCVCWKCLLKSKIREGRTTSHVVAVEASTDSPLLETYARSCSKSYVPEEEDALRNLDQSVRNLSINARSDEVEGFVTAKDVVLRRCEQGQVLDFEECFSRSSLQNCQKIGEGVYGEVFLYRKPNGETSVLKVIPIEGDQMVNGERQKKFGEILSEIVITKELSNLTDNNYNSTSCFVKVEKIRCTYGRYPERLLDLWELYDENKGSENDNPEMFGNTQLYIVLELANGGQDLETFVFNNAGQAFAMIKQIAFALAVAEKALKFEHRDLHWGNILLTRVDKNRIVKFALDGRKIEVDTHGVQVTIIDFTLSRVEFDGVVIFNDLGQDKELFIATGDYQFDIYKLMQKRNRDEWQHFEPYSNVLWMHYLLDKTLSAVRYKYSKSKIHKGYLKQLKKLKNEVLDFNSIAEFVTSSFL